MHPMDAQVPVQRRGLGSAEGAGITGFSRRVEASAAPPFAAGSPAVASEQFSASHDDWAFVALPAAQKQGGAHSAQLHDPPTPSLERRTPLEQVGRVEDCDAELIIPCGRGADVFAEEVILC